MNFNGTFDLKWTCQYMEMWLTVLNRYVHLRIFCRNTIKEELQEVLGVRCLHVRLYGSYKGKEFPEYNYRLPGVGKKSPKSFSRQNLSIDINGEVLFGIHPISLALRANKRKFYRLFIKENTKYKEEGKRIVEQAGKLNVPVVTVTKNDLDKLSGSRPNQGMCMDVSELPVSVASTSICWTEIKSRWRYPVWLMPYNVQDPMNFGAILRTSFFLGVDRVLTPEKNSCRLSPVVSKASSGALEVMEGLVILREEQDVVEIFQNWKDAGGVVVGASTDRSARIPVTPLQDLAVNAPVFIVVGNEERGISSAVMGQCSRAVFVPGADIGLVDSPEADTGLVDSPSADTGLVDSPSADTGLVDSLGADIGLVDSPSADTGLVDSPGDDTGLVDSPSADIGLVDSPVNDTGLVDLPRADNRLVNSPSADTGLVDSHVNDTGLVDLPSADNRLVNSPSADTGLVDSLNVSVATGIIIYHVVSNNERIKE